MKPLTDSTVRARHPMQGHPGALLRGLGLFAIAGLMNGVPVLSAQTVQVSGELRQWHVVTLTFDGPAGATEDATPNPFLDFRLDVTFRHGVRSFVVPGYYAADGRAADSSADAGSKWRVHFVPDATGVWSWSASFRSGPRAAVGGPAGAVGFDGESGRLTIAPTDDSPTHPRGRGLLRYVGERYLRFAGTAEPFLEVGPNSPENLLAFADFDGTRDMGGIVTDFLHRFGPHESDFVGGPTWGNGRGRNLLGALSYLGSAGMNSIYVITLTRHGDGDDVWPWRDDDDPWRFDCSKLDQWNRVFDHATETGLHLQLVLTETENESYFEVRTGEPTFSDARRLYYREMVARFGHHLALTWNLGEENGWDDWSRTAYRAPNNEAQRRAFAAAIKQLDPYDHPIVVHTYHGPRAGEDQDGVYGPLTDPQRPCEDIDGASLQGPFDPSTSVVADSDDLARNNHAKVRYWVERAERSGHPWVVGHHEEMPARYGTAVDGDPRDPDHDTIRSDVLWGTLMAGGAGVQYYFGYGYRETSGDDLTAESFRTRSQIWEQSRHAVDFFQEHLPFSRMSCRDELVSSPKAYCLAADGDVFAVYLREGGAATLDVGAHGGVFEVLWFDPRSGGGLQRGTVAGFSGTGPQDVGLPPYERGRDWLVLVARAMAVPDAGCPGAIQPIASGAARLGHDVEVRLPGVTPAEFPVIVVGARPMAPIEFPAMILCAPYTRCTMVVDPIETFPGATIWRDHVPPEPGLVGGGMRVQGVLISGPPACVKLTGALDIPFER
jgi:hypothetical protein